ncbi:cytidylyltransferase domain-containing protein [Thiohalorhabdus methylotrophus]|uniref:Cytidylyltransferase domain-containing protein n=1 Tax=Thiohalorhabdus methylotrophus TaxID=3242694 RepID=A0ABV4TYZ9_9GAMM
MDRLAIIPARGGSKRLPRKNLADLGGRPVVSRVIHTALESALFDRVVVSTEDKEIGEVAAGAGAEVHWRDPSLATDQASVIEVCSDLLGGLREVPERFCCLYATAAFLAPGDLKDSEAFLAGADVVMGVSGYPIHPYKALEESEHGFLRPKWPTENDKKSQYFPWFVASNGTFYWARTEPFLKEPTFFPNRLKGYELPPERAVDIDTVEDLQWARKLLAIQQGSPEGGGK